MADVSPQSQRIALLLPDLRGGGAERVCLDLAREFVRRGHIVELVVMQAKGELLEEAKSVCHVVDLNAKRARNLPLALMRYIRRREPDSLIAAMWPLTVIAPLAVRLSGHRTTVVVSEHGILSLQYQKWGRIHRLLLRLSTAAGYRLADHRVGVSGGVVRDMAALSAMPEADFSVIYNPILQRPVPGKVARDMAEKLWGGPSGARIISVGTLKAVKNHAMLLRAFSILDIPKARLLLLGDGPERPALTQLTQQLDIAERVIFAGFKPDPTPFYATADLFVLSSNAEGFGNVIVEAMGQGTPIVATDCPAGPREILAEGQFGGLTPVGDVVALADAMTNSLRQPNSPEKLQRRAAQFSPGRAADAYLDLLAD